MNDDRRRFPRFKVRVPIELLTEDGPPLRGHTSDLSLGGCYVESLFPLPAGTPVDVRLTLTNEVVIADGTVATCDRQVGNGIRFSHMLAEDSDRLELFLSEQQCDTLSSGQLELLLPDLELITTQETHDNLEY
jgi:hypothetical protein